MGNDRFEIKKAHITSVRERNGRKRIAGKGNSKYLLAVRGEGENRKGKGKSRKYKYEIHGADGTWKLLSTGG